MSSIKLDSAPRLLYLRRRKRTGIATGLLIVIVFFLISARSNSSGMQVENRPRFKERPQLLPQVGHNGMVSTLAFGANNTLLATGGFGDTVKIWDVRRGILLIDLPVAVSKENSLVFSPDGELLVSISMLGKALIWDVATGQLKKILPIEASGVVEFSTKGQWLAVSSGFSKDYVKEINKVPNDGTGRIKIFETATWTELATLTMPNLPANITTLSFSHNDQLIACGIGEVGQIKIWETSGWQNVQSLEGPGGWNTAIAFSPDHKFLACLGGPLPTTKEQRIGSVSTQMVVRIWNVSTWHVKKTLTRNYLLSNGVSISADGLSLVAFLRGEARVWKNFWDDSSRREMILALDAIPTGEDPVINNVNFGISGMYGTLSSDGHLLAFSSGSTIVLWNIVQGRKERVLTGMSQSSYEATLSPNNRFLAIEDVGGIAVWDLTGGNILYELPTDSGSMSIIFSPNSRFLASVTQHYTPVDNNIAYTKGINLWDMETGLKLPPIEIPGIDSKFVGFISCFSPDGQWLAVAYNNSINVWEVATRRAILNLDVHDDPRKISKLAFSVDGKWLAAAASDGNATEIKFWRAPNWQAEAPLQLGKDYVSALAFSSDNRLLGAARNGKITFWEIGTWKENRTLPRPFGLDAMFTPDLGKLVSIGRENIELLNLQTGQQTVLDTPSSIIPSVEISPDGSFILAPVEDGFTRIWDGKTGDMLFSLALLSTGGDWLVVTDDGLFDGTADAFSQISWRFGSIRNIVPMDWYFNDFYYPGLLAELMTGKRPKACVDIATVLRLPGLHTMLEQNLARIERQGDRIIVCFADRPTALTFSDMECEGNDRQCVCRKEFTPGSSQYEWLKSLTACKPKPISTPWDNKRSDGLTGTLHVLTVGIDKYDKSTSGLDSLTYSVSDAKAMRDFFSKEKNSASKPFEDVRIWPSLYDAEATLDAIRNRMEAMAKEVKKTDVVFLFFSGHGKVPVGQEMFYFAPIDMLGPDPEDERASGLNTAMLAEALYRLPAQRVVVVIDACQSGGAVESLRKIGEVKAKVEMQKAINEEVSPSSAKGPGVGVFILAAATPLHIATQNKRFASSEFVVALLEALKTAGRRGQKNVWMKDVVNYVNQRLPVLLKGEDSNRKPMIVSMGLDFPIASRRN